jgi:hypothetical protein
MVDDNVSEAHHGMICPPETTIYMQQIEIPKKNRSYIPWGWNTLYVGPECVYLLMSDRT